MLLFDKSKFKTKKDMFQFMVDNKSTLIAQKRSIKKEPDYGIPFIGSANAIYNKKIAYKSNELIENPANELKVLAAINTTNWFDSHEDVHFPGIWDKTVAEGKMLMHVQEHKSNEYSKIISDGDDLNVFIREYSWKELHQDFEGTTQALMFDSLVRKSRNEEMHKNYAKGWVRNHSPAMQYVKLIMCINDEDFGAEFEAFEKYISKVVNKEDVYDNGYFWGVFEAKLYEGSAVPRGSNIMTPTIENNNGQDLINEEDEENKDINFEPLIDALDKQEPEKSTLNIEYLINNI